MALTMDKRLRGSSDRPSRSNVLASLLQSRGFCGRSFNHGLLRFHNDETAAKVDEYLAEAISRDKDEITPIAYDWLGRQLLAVETDGESQVLMLDPARAVVDEVCTVPQFFTILGHEDIEEVFSGSTFNIWREAEVAKREDASSIDDVELPFEDCVAFIQPIVDGGEDALENVRVEDVQEYWGRI